MKTFACALIAAYAVAGFSPLEDLPFPDVNAFEEKLFTNKIDHFDLQDDRTY